MKIEKVLIVGLGLIGGSYAKGFMKNNIKVYAIDSSKETIDFAKKNNIIIDGETKPTKQYIENFDIIIFALYPKVFLEFIKEYKDFIKNGAKILDVSGIKKELVFRQVLFIPPSGFEPLLRE